MNDATSAVQRIRSAELEAARRIETAREEATALIAGARAEARQMVEDARRAGLREADRRVADAASQAEDEARLIAEEGRRAADRLYRAAMAKREEIVVAFVAAVLAPPSEEGK